MKKLLFLLLFVSLQAGAGPAFKYGGFIDSTNENNQANALTVMLDPIYHIRPVYVRFSNGLTKTSGIGADYVYTLGHRGVHFQAMIGAIGFEDRFNNGRPGNAHLGLGVRLKNTVMSIDAYGNSDSKTSLIANIGYQF